METHVLETALPRVATWIDQTLADHAGESTSVASFGFERLPLFYSDRLLKNSKVIVVEKVALPPLAEMGLTEFSDFESMDSRGITYKDTYFVAAQYAKDEALHFHELVHVVQWGHLGMDRFLRAYALGLAQFGYVDCPLEKMAFGLHNYFEQGRPFDVEAAVRTGLDQLNY